MTPEFGAASQLEKIDMLDLADLVAINKFDRRGADDALRAVRRQWARNHVAFGTKNEDMPVFGTIAARFNDEGTTALYQHVRDELRAKGLITSEPQLPAVTSKTSVSSSPIVPAERIRYLAEIAGALRSYHATTETQTRALRQADQVAGTIEQLSDRSVDDLSAPLVTLAQETERRVDAESRELLERFAALKEEFSQDELVTVTPSGERRTPLKRESLSGTLVPRVALPRFEDNADLYRWLRAENLPGRFPFTAGVFPLKRENEDPARMFAGEGDAYRTNRRFHLLSQGQPATRLSTAFDSVTLYGQDPDTPPDVYGKIGTSGVSIATLDDMKVLYDGFDLCDPATSVSMTINGPAPTILAMFMNTAIDQQLDRFTREQGRAPSEDRSTRHPSEHSAHHPRDGASGHLERGPGPEHLHLFDRVLPRRHGRHPGVLRRP